MTQIRSGSKVTLSYIGTLDDGTIFYSTEDHEPLEVTIGADQLFPALENALIGMREGEARNLFLSAEEAYGPRRKENLVWVGRDTFPSDQPITVGRKLGVAFSGGVSRVMRVAAVQEERVMLDGNHPLAGYDLTFALRVDRVEA